MILELVEDGLRPLPGNDGLLLYSTEVPQVLYTAVTGKNPSNSKAPQLPVESVTWEEARAFNTRLGYILARPVDLPSRLNILAAIGGEDPQELAARAWSSENTGRETRPPGRSSGPWRRGDSGNPWTSRAQSPATRWKW